MEIKAKISRSAKDLGLAYDIALKRDSERKSRKVKIYTTFFGGIVLLIFNAYFVFLNVYTDWTTTITINLIALAMLVFLYFKKPPVMFNADKLITENPKMGLEESIIINEDGIHSTTANGTSTVHWSGFKKAIITHDQVLLSFNSHQFYVYPKRFFSEQDFKEFAKMLKHKVNQTTEQ